VGRECLYPEKAATPQRSRALSVRESSDVPAKPPVEHAASFPPDSNDDCEIASRSKIGLGPGIGIESSQQISPSLPLGPQDLSGNQLLDDNFFLNDNLFAFDETFTPSFGPVEWYDLLAEDAINSMQGQPHSSRWDFDITTLSRRQSPRQSVAPELGSSAFNGVDTQSLPVLHKHWNTENAIELKQEEAPYYKHFIDVVAPILDLFDPGKHFASVVPHLALRNVGLLKSILAVGACHMNIFHDPLGTAGTPSATSPEALLSPSSTVPNVRRVAERYYYETLQYLSQHLLYQAYTTSNELLSTAVMISIYEVREYLTIFIFALLTYISRCSAQSMAPTPATGTGICEVHSGFRRTVV
jgi:hypothetical protein